VTCHHTLDLRVASTCTTLTRAFVWVNVFADIWMAVLTTCLSEAFRYGCSTRLPHCHTSFIGGISQVVFNRSKKQVGRIDAQTNIAMMADACAMRTVVQFRNRSVMHHPRDTMGYSGNPPNFDFSVPMTRSITVPYPATGVVDRHVRQKPILDSGSIGFIDYNMFSHAGHAPIVMMYGQARRNVQAFFRAACYFTTNWCVRP
jgi:hypothetical protein